jgi:hypothetical protein
MDKLTLFLIIVALLLIFICICRYRKYTENYNQEKDDLIGYLDDKNFDADVFKEKMSKMTEDKEAIEIAYSYALDGNMDNLFKFIDNYFPA